MRDNTETAILAGGCYWLTQVLLGIPDGVTAITAGWTGGDNENQNPTEEDSAGHAEAVRIVFDPERISYRVLLELFFQIHRPDLGEEVVGSTYRSEIFYTTEEQRRIAEDTIADVDAAGFWPPKVATRVSEAGPFWEAEADDQHYLRHYPDGNQFPRPRPAAASRETAA